MPTAIDGFELREIDYYRSHETVEPRVYVSYLRNAYHGREDPSLSWILTQEMCGRISSLCTGMTQLDWVTTTLQHGEIFSVLTATKLRQR